jgi:UDP-N-acetyl-D-mannosaminuronic acid dehydrogenase
MASQVQVSGPEVCVLGGAGHIGLPLSILLAHKGKRVLVYDINQKVLDTVATGQMPFMEDGAEPLLKEVLATGRLSLSSKLSDYKGIDTIVITIGTPVDEFLNPTTKSIAECMDSLLPVLEPGQLLVLRSTVAPGTTIWLDRYLKERGKEVDIAFCPERVVQGHAIKEIQALPQIVSGVTPRAEERAAALFRLLAPEIVRMQPMEAEFAKLYSNAYRYIQFAAANQFYMLASLAGLDYAKIQEGMCRDYHRMRDLPKPGFAAGPCLFKDTMQLAAFAENNFSIGYDAMRVNEGLPLFLIDQIRRKGDLKFMKVGLLGMAFKSDSDDIRASLSYKLKKALQTEARAVLTTDPHVKNDPELVPIEKVLTESDLLILCTPHAAYKKIDLRGKPVIDIWNFFGKGTSIPNFT